MKVFPLLPMSYLPQTKYGDCSCGCGGKDVQGRKVGKVFYCLDSYQRMKTQEQVAKAGQRDRLRKAGREQLQSGDYSAAERQALINECDFCFSRIVRMMGSDEAGNCKCYTCGNVKHWSLQQCGHYEKRANTQLRWDFRNGKPQCQTCNENKHGNLEVYTRLLEQEQKGLPEQLKEIAREPYKWTKDELKGLLISLREKLRIIELKFKPKQSA